MSREAQRIVVGWDLGGAHVKAATVSTEGVVRHVVQRPCPLWRGLAQLRTTVKSIVEDMQTADAVHVVTMTGELADVFVDRAQGVRELLDVMTGQLAKAPLLIYAGHTGFLTPEAAVRNPEPVASANWFAAAQLTAGKLAEGLFVDVGSTTTDMLIFAHGRVEARGYSDHQRLTYDELIYTGVVRTPVMAVVDRVAFSGAWVSVMAEQFATMADVYRLTRDLPEYADMLPSADGGDKSDEASARRLARMLGRDAQPADAGEWRRVAEYMVECQLARLRMACETNLSRGILSPQAPLVGAGVGRFLVRALATRLARPFVDFGTFFPPEPLPGGAAIADCAPAVAVALLASAQMARRGDLAGPSTSLESTVGDEQH
jgi:(4-(4-[2-(gamma-L-glutamylamino)ethyl]phenoxymethyl)furan-2-yl)methanamine synthase